MKPKAQWEDYEDDRGDDEPDWLTKARREQWRMVYRAGVIFLILAIGLGAIISFLGGDPLAFDWFLPKVLLVIVILALLMALANSHLLDEGEIIAGLIRGVSRPFSRYKERNKK